MRTQRHYILNYAFIISLIVLVINDHILKAAFGNWFTGKLSDFAGMVILPLLVAFVFPKLKTHAIWISALLFAFWKSPLSGPLIELYNAFAPIDIERVVDYTDLLAFAILPLPYFIIKNKNAGAWFEIKSIQYSPMYIVVPCVFAIIATSPPPSYYYTRSTGNLSFKKTCITVKNSPEEILAKLYNNGISPVRDMTVDTTWARSITYVDREKLQYYKLPQLIVEQDTLTDLEFSLRPIDNKTRIYLNSVNIQKGLGDEQLEKKLKKIYRKAAKKYFKETLKD